MPVVATAVRNSLIDLSMVAAVIRNSWQTPESQDLLERIMWSNESQFDVDNEVTILVAVEFLRQTILGTGNCSCRPATGASSVQNAARFLKRATGPCGISSDGSHASSVRAKLLPREAK